VVFGQWWAVACSEAERLGSSGCRLSSISFERQVEALLLRRFYARLLKHQTFSSKNNVTPRLLDSKATFKGLPGFFESAHKDGGRECND
jgi:hypothetical protein